MKSSYNCLLVCCKGLGGGPCCLNRQAGWPAGSHLSNASMEAAMVAGLAGRRSGRSSASASAPRVSTMRRSTSGQVPSLQDKRRAK